MAFSRSKFERCVMYALYGIGVFGNYEILPWPDVTAFSLWIHFAFVAPPAAQLAVLQLFLFHVPGDKDWHLT